MWVLIQHRELIRDARWIFLFLLLNGFLQLILCASLDELGMLEHLSQRSVAWNDVSLHYLLQILIEIVSNPELGPNVCSDSFLKLSDVDMDNI